MINLKYVFTFMVFLLSVINASDASFCNINMTEESISLLMVGLIISILFVSFFYMYGKFMSNSEVEGTYMVELQQIGLTIVMIILITGGIQILCNVNFNQDGLMIGSSDVYSSVRASQLDLMGKTMKFYTSLMNAINSYSILGSAQGGFGSDGKTITFSPVPAGNFIAQTMAPIGQTVLLAYLAQAFQFALLEFSRSKIFLMLLPIGLVLRSFPITRKFGGVIIALVLGLSYIYPLLLNFGYLFVNFDSITPVKNINAIGILVGLSTGLIGLSLTISANPAIMHTIISGILMTVFQIGSLVEIFEGGSSLSMLSTITLSGQSLVDIFNSMYSAYGSILLVTFFIPAFIIIILSAIIRSLSASIGTETDISGILRAI